jgi:alpha-tubulin suppressor-like RCC1 family protein
MRNACLIAITGLILFLVLNSHAVGLTFTDIGANLTGVDGASVAWGDYDNDGQLDLLITGSGTSYIYHNSNGVFTVSAVLTGLSYGQAVWGDYNNDGRLDVMQDGFASGAETWQIYRNDGSNTFTQIALPVPGFGNISGVSLRFVSCAWGDYDNDGKLDALFVGWPYSALYHNNGGGSFTNSGINIPAPAESDVAWADYNNDGNLDFVVNGGGGSGITALYENLGGGVIVPATNVLTGVYEGSAAWEDYNNDGNLDLAITGLNNNQGYYISMVYAADGHGGFTNLPAGIDGTVYGSIAWGDFDNDGLPDLVVSSSASTGTTKIYHNNGDGTFTDTGVSLPGCGDGGIAVGDFNNDGKLDIAIVGSGVAKIFRNDSAIPANTPPSPPQFFSATPTTKAMVFSWTASTHLNQYGGLSYNLRVGTTPGGVDVVSPMADAATGLRRIPALGNAGLCLSKSVTQLKAGTYYWGVQAIDHDFAASAFTTETSFTISAPAFTMQPLSQTNASGTTAAFQVATTGTLPISYQWFLNGTPRSDGGRITGSATTNLAITNLQVSDAGNYTVVVANVAGSVTSQVATLTITAPPVITSQPTNVTLAVGAAAVFTVTPAGTGPFTYQWQFGGTNINGGTNVSLALTDLQLNQSGPYDVVVSNAYGGVVSSNAVLTVIPLTVTIEPQTQSATGGGTVALSASVGGVGPFGYQWQFGATNIANATSSTLILTNVQLSQQGGYDVIVSNAYGFVVSSNSQLTVNPWARIQPPVQLTAAGATLTFTAVEGGLDTGANFQWQFMGTNLPGATVNPLVLTNLRASQAGAYDVIASNAFGMAVSSNAILSLGPVVAWGDNTYGQTNVPPLANIAAIAAGYNHNLALGADGTVTAWGDNSSGQTNVPAGLNNVMAISAGNGFSAALESNGVVVVWGSNGNGQTNVPAGLSNVVSICCGGSHILALKSDGNVMAWGYNLSGQASVPAGLSNVVAVTAGRDFSLALKSDGTVTGWGFNGNGALNIPSNLSNVVAISGQSAGHVLALKRDGMVTAWGFNYYGEASVPAGLSNVMAVAAGYYHSLALEQNGTVVAWGDSSSGKTSVPAGLAGAIGIAAGSGHSLALLGTGAPVITQQPFSPQLYSGQTVILYAGVAGGEPLSYQWQFDGTNLDGATNEMLVLANASAANAGTYSLTVYNGFGSTTSSSVALTVPVSAPVILGQPVSAWSLIFSNVTLSVNASGSWPLGYQWEFNGTNLNNATNSTLTFTNLQLPNEGVYDVIVSNLYGTVISSNAFLSISHVVLWGSPSNQPPGLTNVIAINGYPAALKSDGTVKWWNSSLIQVYGLSNVVAIAQSLSYTGEALLTNGNVLLWTSDGGYKPTGSGSSNVVAVAGNNYGDLELRPNGTLAGSVLSGAPPAVLSLSNVVAVSQGTQHSLALKADGTVVAWGNNGYGQINVPIGLSNVLAIAAGGYHSLALKNNGTVIAWGANLDRQINVPAGLSNVVAVAAGGYHSLALKNDGTVIAWGRNTSGQTNVPAGLSNVVMIAAGQTDSLALEGNSPPETQALLASPSITSNSFSLTLPTQSGRVYALEFKKNAGDTNWDALPLNFGTGTNVILTDPAATNSQRFYRVRRW